MSVNWAADLKKIAEKGKEDLCELSRAIKIELFNSAVDDTRVDTGLLKGNWSIQEKTKPRRILKTLDPDGKKVKARIEKIASPDGVTYFVNSLSYAAVYEREDAMVGRNVARLQQIVKTRAAKL